MSDDSPFDDRRAVAAANTDAAGPCPHTFWQETLPPDASDTDTGTVRDETFVATLPDGRRLALPIRERDGGRSGLASLIFNQASFAVQDTLAAALAKRVALYAPDVVVGVPTLGLPLAEQVARRLGHSRFVALGTSRKFWYEHELSVPLSSVTSPGQPKRLYLDPRSRPLLHGSRIVLVDDVISTGSSIGAAVALLGIAGMTPSAIACAMLQGARWSKGTVSTNVFDGYPIASVFRTPALARAADGTWLVRHVDGPDEGYR